MTRRASPLLAWLALYLSAAFSLAVERGLLGSPVAPDLSRLPARAGTLELLEELPFEREALGAQPPERWSFRRVRDSRGHEGRLFVAYYERAQRWSGRPHDVEKCFAALGWEEREVRRLDEPHRPWSRTFERSIEGAPVPEALRVVHWLERPGPDRDALSSRELLARLAAARGFRPDMASIYLEFPAHATPDDPELVAAVAALSAALEALW
jgi:hypothetical protein